MKKYVDADELKKVFRYTEDAEYARWTLAGVLYEIDDIEAADVEEVRHGRWENIYSDNYKCSVCGAWYRSDEPIDFVYCPNCGAKMVNKDD